MSDIKVSFFGLCYVRVPKADALPHDVYLLSQHGHVTTVAIPVDAIDVQASTRFPDAVVYHDNVQIACYTVAARDGVQATISLTGDRGDTTWDPSDRKQSIHFAEAHPNKLTKELKELLGELNAVVKFTGGKVECGNAKTRVKLLKKNETLKEKLPASIDWFPDDDVNVLTVEFAEHVTSHVVLKAKKDDVDRTVSITNVSTHKPSPGTLADHFALYYSLLTPEVPKPDRLTLKDLPRPSDDKDKSPDRPRSEEAYDCVPPGTGS